MTGSLPHLAMSLGRKFGPLAAAQSDAFVRQVDGLAHQGDAFACQSDSFAAQGDTFGANRPRHCHRRQHPPSLLRLVLAALALLALAAPAAAKDSLGVFGQWGAFRDPAVPRCYAIVAAEEPRRREVREQEPFASVGTWPRRGVRGQVHLRLSRSVAQGAAISLSLGGRRFALAGAGGDAWARDATMDAAIVAAMRSAPSMAVYSRDRSGRRFTERYSLEGAATAMDAATVGCARIR